MGIFNLVGSVVGLGADVIKAVDENIIEPITDAAEEIVDDIREEIK